MTKILALGKVPEILEVLLRLINNQENWTGVGVSTIKDAFGRLQDETFDILLLGGGIEKEEENSLRKWSNDNLPKLKIVQHFGGGSGLLYNEIQEALETSE